MLYLITVKPRWGGDERVDDEGLKVTVTCTKCSEQWVFTKDGHRSTDSSDGIEMLGRHEAECRGK